jgi:hypothetical protein
MIALGAGLSCSTQAQQICRPALAFKHVRLSEMREPTLEWTWTAILSVDASRCATKLGTFGLTLERLKENAPDIDFHEAVMWRPNSVEVSVTLWADEAVNGYGIDNVAPCPCLK